MPRNATTLELDGQASEPFEAIGPGAGTTIPTINLSLQGKAGVGKSLVANILAQHFLHHGVEIHWLDTDPVNQIFSQYSALGAEHLELMRVDSRGFDVLMERLLTEDGIFIVDNGASYIVEYNVLDLLRAAGRKLCVYTVVTGGQALGDTLKGFKSLADSSVERNILLVELVERIFRPHRTRR